MKLVLEKAEEQEIKLPTSDGSLKKQEFQKNIYFCFIDYAKAFDCESEKWKWSRSVVSDPQWPHGLQPTRLLHP